MKDHPSRPTAIAPTATAAPNSDGVMVPQDESTNDSRHQSHALSAATEYVERGWAVVPIPFKSKAPVTKGWPTLRLATDQLAEHFCGATNLGVLLGEPSGSLIDIDLDSREARALAAHFLPGTNAKFGRLSSRASHWLYQTDGPTRRTAFQTPAGDMILELRGSGAQTIFPPSTHPSGEAIAWESGAAREPTTVSLLELKKSCGYLAAAALLLRHWSHAGSRHEKALALAGMLLSGGMNVADARLLVEAVARAAGDNEVRDRVRSIETTANRLARGNAVAGPTRLAELIGIDDTQCISKWLGLRLVVRPVGRSDLISRPLIRVVRGELPRVIDEIEAALMRAEIDLYQRGSKLVRPSSPEYGTSSNSSAQVSHLHEVSRHHLAELVGRAAALTRLTAKGDWIAIDCPISYADAYIGREGSWRLPQLTAIINAPTLRPDGSIIEEPGYDTQTGLLYQPSGKPIGPVPSNPGWDDARRALEILIGLISTFPFVALEDRSVALSAILTGVVRASLPTAPLHAFTAPAAGSGKSLLVDIAAMIATGSPASVLEQGRTDEESSKRIGAALIAGDLIISIDNCTHPVGGEQLCQALTQKRLKIRRLGHSVNVDVVSAAAFYATGNNLAVSGDMTRRCLLCSLDAKVERPELRTFARNPLKLVEAERSKHLVAALTVLRAFAAAGRPQQLTPLGSFEDWSHAVRDPLIWLGEPDPCITITKLRATDHKLEALTQVLVQWDMELGSDVLPAKEIAKRASGDFLDALLVVAGDGGDKLNIKRLGKWLSAHRDRVVGGKRIVEAGAAGGVKRWRLEKLDALL